MAEGEDVIERRVRKEGAAKEDGEETEAKNNAERLKRETS
jgi:hypothetical protein